MTQYITQDGLNVMLRGLLGDTIEFTKIKFGNGFPGDNASDLVNPLLELGITSKKREGNYITLSCTFVNSELAVDAFWATEIAVYAKDPEDTSNEICYAIWEETDISKADYISSSGERILESQYTIHVFVSSVENVTASLTGSFVYASAADLEAHTSNKNNPHGVTKEQIGLGNVENKAIGDQTPSWTISKTLVNLVSGEKLSIAFGKIAKAIEALINHINDKQNPHGITAKSIGAAATSHSHAAADINSGTIPVVRGGTGLAKWTKHGIVYAKDENTLGQIDMPTLASFMVLQKGYAPTFVAVDALSLFAYGTNPPTTNKLWIDTTPTTGGLKYYNESSSSWEHVPVSYT